MGCCVCVLVLVDLVFDCWLGCWFGLLLGVCCTCCCVVVWCLRFDCVLLLLAVGCAVGGDDVACLLVSFGLCFVFICLRWLFDMLFSGVC